MPYLPVFLTLAAIWTLVVISPEPCFVATVQQATRGRCRDGVFVALGIDCSCMLRNGTPPNNGSSRPFRARDGWFFEVILCSAIAAAKL
jgi:hypothetical protein